MQRWHYTRLSYLDGWMRMIREGDVADGEDAFDRSARASALQDTMLDELGQQGFVVYEVQVDENSRPMYFLRRPVE